MKETKFGVGGYPLVCKKAPLLPFSRVRYHGVAISYAISWKDRWRKSSVMWKKKKEEEKKLNLKFFSRLIIKIELWHSFFFFFSINTQPFRFFPFPIYNAFRTERERERERENSKLKLPFVKKYAWKLLLRFDGANHRRIKSNPNPLSQDWRATKQISQWKSGGSPLLGPLIG